METDVQVERLANGFRLAEAPVWHPSLGLLFSDTLAGGVFALTPGSPPSTLIPHRRGIGGMALHAGGGIVVGGRNIAVKERTADRVWRTIVIAEPEPDHGIVGFNDLTTDAAGRIYVGSIGFDTRDGLGGDPGHLHVIDLDGRMRIVADDVLMTNGLAFSPDGRTLYHADSLRPAIYAYHVDSSGDLIRRRVFAAPLHGHPDGIVVATDGSIFVALSGAGCVLILDAGGRETGRISIDVPMATSVCFGGRTGDLFIVSGDEGAEPESGSVHRAATEHVGLDVPLCRISLGGGEA